MSWATRSVTPGRHANLSGRGRRRAFDDPLQVKPTADVARVVRGAGPDHHGELVEHRRIAVARRRAAADRAHTARRRRTRRTRRRTGQPASSATASRRLTRHRRDAGSRARGRLRRVTRRPRRRSARGRHRGDRRCADRCRRSPRPRVATALAAHRGRAACRRSSGRCRRATRSPAWTVASQSRVSRRVAQDEHHDAGDAGGVDVGDERFGLGQRSGDRLLEDQVPPGTRRSPGDRRLDVRRDAAGDDVDGVDQSRRHRRTARRRVLRRARRRRPAAASTRRRVRTHRVPPAPERGRHAPMVRRRQVPRAAVPSPA